MIEKVVARHSLQDPLARRRDLESWLSRTPEERLAAVEFLRRPWYGTGHRLQRVVRVVPRAELRKQP